ncbi:MAG: hypothetical protein MMC23_006092 [Stictis urceolatum]|nr:hypothetical protein [Stictis urceolata]
MLGQFTLKTLLLAIPALFAQAVRSYTLPTNCSDGLLTTPTYGDSGAVFTICGQTTISSTADKIYNIVLDFPLYAQWNTFVVSVDVPSNVTNSSNVYEGMPMTLHTQGLIEGANTTSVERITLLEPDNDPPFVAWKYDPGPVSGALTIAEHVSLFIPLAGEGVKHVSYETYYGSGSLLVETLKPNLQNQFQAQAEDLKRRAEAS